MKCGLCGRQFDEQKAQGACRGCGKAAGCGLVRCPYCGYEAAPEPGWLRRLRAWRKTYAQSRG